MQGNKVECSVGYELSASLTDDRHNIRYYFGLFLFVFFWLIYRSVRKISTIRDRKSKI